MQGFPKMIFNSAFTKRTAGRFGNFAILGAFFSLSLIFATQILPDHALGQSDNDSAWNQWRGAQRDGMDRSRKWPKTLAKENLKRAWRIELGPSYSGPVFEGNLVFVTETKNEKTEVVRAIDRSTGKQIWEQEWAGSMKVPFFAASNGSWIRATPAVADGRLYVAGMVDVLVCLNSSDGKILWKIDFPSKYGTNKPDFGFVSSPLIDGEFVYVQAGGSFCKIEGKSGKIVWRTLKDGGGMMGSAFSSPVISTLNGKRQILVQTRSTLCGVNPEDGNVLWTQDVPNFRGMNILTPTVFNNSVFTSTYQNSSFLYEIKGVGSKQESSLKWKNRLRGYMSSPIVLNGHAYYHLQNRCIACVDLATGEQKWRSERFGKYASFVAQGDRILSLDQRGELILFRATPEKFELMGRVKVSDQETWAHLAVIDNEIYVRELKGLTKFEWRTNSE